jgi:hypothetical protein
MATIIFPAASRTLYADFTNLARRLPIETLLKIFDRNKDGQPDDYPYLTYAEKASAAIDEALGGQEGVFPKPLPGKDGHPGPPFSTNIVEIAEDGMLWRMGMDYPTVMMIDHRALEGRTAKRLAELRKGQKGLSDQLAPIGKNHGGVALPRHTLPGHKGQIFSNAGVGRWGAVF